MHKYNEKYGILKCVKIKWNRILAIAGCLVQVCLFLVNKRVSRWPEVSLKSSLVFRLLLHTMYCRVISPSFLFLQF